jgi:hypothetical protein
VRAPDLTPAEVAALPPARSRLLAHLVAFVLLVVYVGVTAGPAGANDPGANDAGAGAGAGFVVGLLLLPFFHRVGLSWWNLLWFLVCPLVAAVRAWQVGFRLVRLPYRDWRTTPSDRGARRQVPGTPYYVVQPWSRVPRDPQASGSGQAS